MHEHIEIIAEIGQNYDGDIGLARELIWQAAEAGASYAKFQVFDPRKIFSRNDNPWWDYNLRGELSRDDVEFLKSECDSANVQFLASAFDSERLGWLVDLGLCRVKIASRSIYDADLVVEASNKFDVVYLSMGWWQQRLLPYPELTNLIRMHCVSQYPAPLTSFKFDEYKFEITPGFSDHSLGIAACLYAIARGATVIEKHFTHDKTAYGPDHSGSLDLPELKSLVRIVNDWSILRGGQ